MQASLQFATPFPHTPLISFWALLSPRSHLQTLHPHLPRPGNFSQLRLKPNDQSATEPTNQHDWPFSRRIEEALNILDLMESQGINPDPNIFCILLNSCAEAQNLEFGKTIHSKLIGTKFEHNVFVANNLIHMYAKCGCFKTAREVFDEMPQRNAVSWTSIISMYGQVGSHEEAIKLYNLMVLDPDVRPNVFTYTVVLNCCAKMKNLEMGVEVHEEIVKGGCENDGFVVTALIDMYAKCGMIENARQVFDTMNEPVVAACTAMVDGYNMNNQGKEGLRLIRKILGSSLGIKVAKELGFMCMIRACIMESALRQGQEIHAHMIKFGYELGAQNISSFISLYEKCNRMAAAHGLFDELMVKSVELWGRMISGYVRNGLHQKALQLYFHMVCDDIEPNSFAISCALDACVGIKCLKEGREIHGRAIKSGYGQFDESLVASLLNLYREFGLLEEVHKLNKSHRSERDLFTKVLQNR